MASTSKRTFEFVEGSSSKFWEAEVSGDELTTRWGRIGTDGQSKTKTFDSAAQARAERDKLIAEKLGKGYNEVAAGSSRPKTLVLKPDEAREMEESFDAFMEDWAERDGLPGGREEYRAAMQAADEQEEVAKAAADQKIKAATGRRPRPPVAKEVKDLVWTFALAYAKKGLHEEWPPERLPAGKQIMQLPPERQVDVVVACFRLDAKVIDQTRYDTLQTLREKLLRRTLPCTDRDCEFLAGELLRRAVDPAGDGIDTHILGALERQAEGRPLTATACKLLRAARDGVAEDAYFVGSQSKEKLRIDVLVGDDKTRVPLASGEAWADAVIADLKKAPAARREAWIRLLRHCADATGSQPTVAWRQTAEDLLVAVSHAGFVARVPRWFALLDRPRTGPATGGRYGTDHPHHVSEDNQDVLRGLVWCCGLVGDPALARPLAAMAVSAYRKFPEIGARAVRVGNACVTTLGAMSTPAAVAQLTFLQTKVEGGTARRLIAKQFGETTKRLKLTRKGRR